MKYDYIVYIGRMQPPHFGHLRTIQVASEHSKNIIILLGSTNSARTPKNLFAFKERKLMLEKSIEDYDIEFDSINILPLIDCPYHDDDWATEVMKSVYNITNKSCDKKEKVKIALIGHHKDVSSYYLDMFYGWEFIEAPLYSHEGCKVNSTMIREEIFNGIVYNNEYKFSSFVVSTSTQNYINDFIKFNKSFINDIAYWYMYDKNYQVEVKKYPSFVITADNVVTHNNRILLVKRKNHPGKGLLALPGGHVNVDETFYDAAIRELQEETKISYKGKLLDREWLEESFRGRFVGDYPYRSSKARVITQVFHFDLPAHLQFDIEAADDAEEVNWYYIKNLKPEWFYDDHYFLIQELVVKKD